MVIFVQKLPITSRTAVYIRSKLYRWVHRFVYLLLVFTYLRFFLILPFLLLLLHIRLIVFINVIVVVADVVVITIINTKTTDLLYNYFLYFGSREAVLPQASSTPNTCHSQYAGVN